MTTATTDIDPIPASLSLLAVLLAAVAIGCLTACGSIDASTDTTGAPRHLASLETPCGPDASFTGAALLDRLDSPYTASLVTGDGKPPATVHLDVSYDGGARRCVAWSASEGSARLELGVTLEVRTDDGAIDASIPGTISVLADSDQVRFSGAAPLADGDISVPAADPRDASAGDKPRRVLIEGWITTDRREFQGAVRLLRERGNDRWNHRTLASWGTSRPTMEAPKPATPPR